MNWWLLPDVPVALLGLWHAAPSRDETLLLASSQCPADGSHVSACLSVNNCCSLPSSSLSFFSLFSIICLLSRTCPLWLAIPPLSTPLSNTPFLSCFSSVFHFFGWPPCAVSSISHSHGDPADRMTSVADERCCTSSVSWMRGSKCSPIIHHITNRNHPN